MIEATETPVSTKKRTRGRPKLVPKTEILDREGAPDPPIPGPEVEPEPQTPFDGDETEPFPPIQPKSSFRTLSTYWNERLTPAQRRQGTVYCYRLWPAMKLVPGRGGRLVNENCEKFNEEDGPLTLELIRNRRRMGIYLLRLNQRIVKPSCEISNCEVEIHGQLGNADDMPVLDVQNLDLNHPSNDKYVEILRSRGIIKGPDAPEGEGAEEMAATETLGQIANTLIQERIKEPQQQQQQPQYVSNDGAVGVKALELVEKFAVANRPPSQQGTVKEQLSGLIEVARTMMPPTVDLTPFTKLQEENNKLVRDMMQKDVERAQLEAAKAREEVAAFKASLPVAKTMAEQFAELEQASRTFARISGRKTKEDGDETDTEKEKAAAASATGFLGILGSLPLLLEKGAQIFQTYTVLRYNEKLTSGQLPINPMTGQADGQPAQPPVSVPQAQQQSQQESNDEMKAQMQDIVTKMETLKPFLLTALRNNKPGQQLAKQLIELAGKEAFEELKVISFIVNNGSGPQQAVGKDAVWVLCQNNPDIWDAEIAPGVKVNQQQHRLAQFLNEFFAYSPVAVN